MSGSPRGGLEYHWKQLTSGGVTRFSAGRKGLCGLMRRCEATGFAYVLTAYPGHGYKVEKAPDHEIFT